MRLKCSAAALSSLFLAASVSAQEEEDLLLAIGTRVAEAVRLSSEVWPGFELPSEFILCGASGLTLLVVPELRKPDLGTLEFVKEERPGVMLLSAPPPGLYPVCFDLRYRIAERELIAVPLIEQAYSLSDPLIVNLAQLYHEAFHRFQQDTFRPTLESGYGPLEEAMLPLSLLNSETFGLLAAEERRLLVRALEEGAVDGKKHILQRYVHIRDRRMALISPALAGAEPHHERKEGTAQLVGLTSAFAVGGLNTARLRQVVIDDLEATQPFAGDEYMRNPYRSSHIYATGAALALVLDDFGIDWRERVAQGWTPYAVLVTEVLDGS